MTDARRHTISADDILNGGPVRTTLSSRTGLSGSKSFTVVTDLNSGNVCYNVEVDGQASEFTIAEIGEAVEFYNGH